MNIANNFSAAKQQHQQIQLLLPWYVNQSLVGHEQRQVETHLRNCLLCRKELLRLQQLSVAINEPADLKVAAEISFTDLRTKMRNKPAGRQSQISAILARFKSLPTNSADTSQRNRTHSCNFAIAATVLLIFMPLVWKWWWRQSVNNYYTLSAQIPASATDKLHVVFTQAASAAQIDALLAQTQLHRVEGPNSIGVYTLELNQTENNRNMTNTIEFLRRQTLIILAEPAIQP
ncbi:hypothetical protein KEF85_07510 [Methylomonas paludis]|uniref:Zinc-finger domain-containing protein n=1 Tax=Methylomonas paludis TaxID=1173101 RepID=A0A975MR79_9GAMM|nr:hypothetical protein [Methylomonas paludis]QWF72284.1 hypothetical protein KEF85_07510 [Methylomonas paludis]